MENGKWIRGKEEGGCEQLKTNRFLTENKQQVIRLTN